MIEVLKKAFKQKRMKYVAVVLVLLVFAVSLNAAFAAFTINNVRRIANISVAGMEYSMSINGSASREKNACEGTTLIDIEVTALNNVSSRYELIYKICETSACTSFIPIPNDFEIKFSSITQHPVYGEVTNNGTRLIRVAIINNTNTCHDIQFGINPGFVHNTLARENLIVNKYTESIYPQGSLLACLFDNNTLRNGTPDFSELVTNENRETEEGLWRIPDEHGEALVFRGTHTGLNNNVIWAGHQWKVLRIDGNDNIRLIYNGTCPNNSCTINGNTAANAAIIGNSEFNNPSNHNRFIGYMFGSATGTFNQQHANTNNSVVKTFVDNWFNNLSAPARAQTVNSTFCIDRSLRANNTGTGLGVSITSYAARTRAAGSGIPTLICPRDEDRINLPAGLITSDEVSMAGGRIGFQGTDFFLAIGAWYWTMSPYHFTDTGASILNVSVAGNMGNFRVAANSSGVRPVITLSSDVMVSSGNGALANPCIVEAPIPPAKGDIKNNNNVRNGNPDFTVVANAANRDQEEGIWRIPDEHGTAYVFRGTHEGLNNNVIFAGHQWKILRIEGNGNIRLIYNGLCPNNTCAINGSTAAASTTIGSSVFNSQANHNRFIGYMHGSASGTFAQQHANINNSTIKTFVDNWFNNPANISATSRAMIANNTLFCSDRSIGNQVLHTFWGFGAINANSGTGVVGTAYGTGERLRHGNGLNNFSPTLVCPREEDRLLLPVGLITMDEFAMAGGRYGLNNFELYLRTNQLFRTMSPAFYGTTSAAVYNVSTSGSDGALLGVHNSSGVRPVISLNSDVVFSSGNGSTATPFIVQP